MFRPRKNIDDNAVPFIDCLDSQSLQVLNDLFGTTHSQKSVRRDIKVRRAEEKPSFWKKLMEERRAVSQ